MTCPEPDRASFTTAFRELSPRVYAYARRQCDVDEAHDVVAETFLVVWRRWSDVPPDPLPWVLVVARNTISNRQRLLHRRARLTETIARLEQVAASSRAADDTVVERSTMLTALSRLAAADRDVLLLVAWDGLTTADAARVVGCSPRAFEVRLSRARARLTRLIDEPPADEPAPALIPIRLGEVRP